MENDSWFERYSIPGQREHIRNKKIKACFIVFIVTAFIFTGLGYTLRYIQVNDLHEEQVAKIMAKYISARDRVADLEARLGIKQKKMGKITEKLEKKNGP